MSRNPPGKESQILVVFEVGGHRCALPISQIQEIVKPPEITPVHLPIEEVRGVINLRGEIVTVIDLPLRMGTPPCVIGKETRIIVVQYQGEAFGLLVEAVDDSVSAEDEDLLPAPANVRTAFGDLFDRVLRTDHDLVSIVNLESALFRNPER